MRSTAIRKASRVVGYIRVSTEAQAESGLSLDAQRAKLQAYATAMDLELVAIVEDAGESAMSLVRAGLARVLGMLDAGEVDGVLVAKLDRLTRSVRDLADLIERYFAERPTVRACTLLSVADSIDTRTAAGRLVLNVLASVGQWEREVIGERTREAQDVLRDRGVKLGRPRAVLDLDAARRRLAEGATQAQVARELGVSVPTLVGHLARRLRPGGRNGESGEAHARIAYFLGSTDPIRVGLARGWPETGVSVRSRGPTVYALSHMVTYRGGSSLQ